MGFIVEKVKGGNATLFFLASLRQCMGHDCAESMKENGAKENFASFIMLDKPMKLQGFFGFLHLQDGKFRDIRRRLHLPTGAFRRSCPIGVRVKIDNSKDANHAPEQTKRCLVRHKPPIFGKKITAGLPAKRNTQ